MSAWDDILTRCETHWRSAVGTLGAGTLGIERAPARASEMTDGEFPHVFFFDLSRTASPVAPDDDGPAAFRQLEVGYSLRMDFWTRNETQDEIRTHVEAFRALIDADATLNGAVEFGYLSVEDIFDADFADKIERKAELILVASVIE